MPTYSYRCSECDHAFDIQQAFTDDSLTECPQCGGLLRKVFGNIGVSFSGSGFYRTDSRAADKASAKGGSSGGTAGGTDKAVKSESAPKAEKAASTSASSSGSSGSSSSGSSSTSGSSGSGSSSSKPAAS